jgi:ABC-type Fe3+/spermidine/putrescine transport system ATPase subunit
VLSQEASGPAVRVGEFVLTAAAGSALRAGAACTLSARPEQIRLSPNLAAVPAGYEPVANVTVTDARFFGQTIRVRLADANGTYLVDLDSAEPIPEAGSPAVMSIRARSAVLIPTS